MGMKALKAALQQADGRDMYQCLTGLLLGFREHLWQHARFLFSCLFMLINFHFNNLGKADRRKTQPKTLRCSFFAAL